jgi:hypothetical protein
MTRFPADSKYSRQKAGSKPAFFDAFLFSLFFSFSPGRLA